MSISAQQLGALNIIGASTDGINLYYSEKGSSSSIVAKLKADGTPLWQFTIGKKIYIDVDKERFVYAGDSGRDVRRLDRNGSQLWVTNNGVNNTIVDIAEGGDAVYVCEDAERFHKFDKNGGNRVWTITSFQNSTVKVEADPTGNSYVATDSANIFKFTPNGTQAWNFSNQSGKVNDMEFLNGFLYMVNDNNSVFKIDASNSSTVWKKNVSPNVAYVSADEQGNVYVFEESGIQKRDSNGNQIWRTTSRIDGLKSAGGDVSKKSKELFIANFTRDIQKVSQDGVLGSVVFSSNRGLNELVIR